MDVDRNPRLHQLLRAFNDRTGCPILVNTSFNVRGEPIVCSPEDAWRCFVATEMDVLVLGDYLILKTDTPSIADAGQRQQHLANFALD